MGNAVSFGSSLGTNLSLSLVYQRKVDSRQSYLCYILRIIVYFAMYISVFFFYVLPKICNTKLIINTYLFRNIATILLQKKYPPRLNFEIFIYTFQIVHGVHNYHICIFNSGNENIIVYIIALCHIAAIN